MSWYLVGAFVLDEDIEDFLDGKFRVRGADPLNASSEVCFSGSSLMEGMV